VIRIRSLAAWLTNRALKRALIVDKKPASPDMVRSII
jgi:hypothetical protein